MELAKRMLLSLPKEDLKLGLLQGISKNSILSLKKLRRNIMLKLKQSFFDFNVFYTDEIIEKLKNSLSVFDHTSILINNVGVAFLGNLPEMTDKNLQNLLNVNTYSLCVVTKILLPKMLLNDKRGGIISISSGVTRFTYPNIAAYTGTKAFLTHFSECLNHDHKDKLDIMVATLGPTKSNINPGIAVLATTPEPCAEHTLNSLGYDSHTFGNYKHCLRDYLLRNYLTRGIVRYVDLQRYSKRS